MSLQQVRQLFEGPVVIAMAGATPPVPIYVDNQIFTDADAAKEHAIVRVDFGLTTEETLQENHERLRGVVTVEIYTLKGRGPGRAQELATLVAQALNNSHRRLRTGARHGRPILLPAVRYTALPISVELQLPSCIQLGQPDPRR